jgi:hypothetical protein
LLTINDGFWPSPVRDAWFGPTKTVMSVLGKMQTKTEWVFKGANSHKLTFANAWNYTVSGYFSVKRALRRASKNISLNELEQMTDIQARIRSTAMVALKNIPVSTGNLERIGDELLNSGKQIAQKHGVENVSKILTNGKPIQ